VGFNPFRDHEKTTLDIVMVVLAILATLAVVGWALLAN
jgi:hypothetical protein